MDPRGLQCIQVKGGDSDAASPYLFQAKLLAQQLRDLQKLGLQNTSLDRKLDDGTELSVIRCKGQENITINLIPKEKEQNLSERWETYIIWDGAHIQKLKKIGEPIWTQDIANAYRLAANTTGAYVLTLDPALHKGTLVMYDRKGAKKWTTMIPDMTAGAVCADQNYVYCFIATGSPYSSTIVFSKYRAKDGSSIKTVQGSIDIGSNTEAVYTVHNIACDGKNVYCAGNVSILDVSDFYTFSFIVDKLSLAAIPTAQMYYPLVPHTTEISDWAYATNYPNFFVGHDNAKIIVSKFNNTIFALEDMTGRSLGYSNSADYTQGGNLIPYCMDVGTVYSFNAELGAAYIIATSVKNGVSWKISLDGSVFGIAVDQKYIYIAGSAGFQMLDRRTGNQVYNDPTRSMCTGVAVVKQTE